MRLGPEDRRIAARSLTTVLSSILLLVTCACAQSDPLPSWNDGSAKQAILQFVRDTTDSSSPRFVPPGQRIAAFDQVGGRSSPDLSSALRPAGLCPAGRAGRPPLRRP
jgi:hypothetical protein